MKTMTGHQVNANLINGILKNNWVRSIQVTGKEKDPELGDLMPMMLVCVTARVVPQCSEDLLGQLNNSSYQDLLWSYGLKVKFER